MKERIGIFGGSFNPPHIAHKIAAEYCRTELRLDRIIFVPTGNHPLKDSTDPKLRLEMSQLAFGNEEYFEVSDIEAACSNEKSYTVDTLTRLKSLLGNDCALVLLIGTDNLLELHLWKEPMRLFELAEVAVITRPGADYSKAEKRFADKVKIVKIPLLEISSSVIRERIQAGYSVRFMIDEKVADFIKLNQLYK